MRKVINRCQWRNTPIYSQPQHPGQLTCFSLSSVEPYQGGGREFETEVSSGGLSFNMELL